VRARANSCVSSVIRYKHRLASKCVNEYRPSSASSRRLRRHEALGGAKLVLVLAHARLASSAGVLVESSLLNSLIHGLRRFRDQLFQPSDIRLRHRRRRAQPRRLHENLLHARRNLRLARLVIQTLLSRQHDASRLILRRSHDESRARRRRARRACAGLGFPGSVIPSLIPPSPTRARTRARPTTRDSHHPRSHHPTSRARIVTNASRASSTPVITRHRGGGPSLSRRRRLRRPHASHRAPRNARAGAETAEEKLSAAACMSSCARVCRRVVDERDDDDVDAREGARGPCAIQRAVSWTRSYCARVWSKYRRIVVTVSY